MYVLNADVLFAILDKVLLLPPAEKRAAIVTLSLTSRFVRDICLPYLFRRVQWPHGGQHDAETGLHFLPEPVWPYIKHFQLVWPDDWPDTSPPRWGDRNPISGQYSPLHINKLVDALPKMPALLEFDIICPFYPPVSIFEALYRCPGIQNINIHETPLDPQMIPTDYPTYHLGRLSVTSVGEALRMGEGPCDNKYTDLGYYTRGYRKRHTNDDVWEQAAAATLLARVGRAAFLRRVEISGGLISMQDFGWEMWPRLHTLVLTGLVPMWGSFFDALCRMPALRDLRLLFSKERSYASAFSSSPPVPVSRFPPLKYLAMSNVPNLTNIFVHTRGLERLCLCAISDHPRVPIALDQSDVSRILGAGSTRDLLLLRVMIEDTLTPDFLRNLSDRCPRLQTLEIERCGYHDGESLYELEEFVSVLLQFMHLRELRICIQFPDYDEADCSDPWRTARRESAMYLALRLPMLRRVGFEHRRRVGTHRYEDNWLDYAIERRGADVDVELEELPRSWYPIPKVWHPVPVNI